jgi:uncharacterized protein YacL
VSCSYWIFDWVAKLWSSTYSENTKKHQESAMNFNTGGGVLGLLILIADIWAIINILQSGASMGSKLLWILLVVLLPVLGLIIWFFAGPRGGRA